MKSYSKSIHQQLSCHSVSDHILYSQCPQLADIGEFLQMCPNSLNFNVTFPNLVYMCGYKLPIAGKNLAQKDSLGRDIVKNFYRVTFLTLPVC